MDRINQTIRLRDGRQLGFAEYGAEKGSPVVYFHGWPSSRLEAGAMDEVCKEMGMRAIAPDRPGFGLSDFKPGRSIADFSDDVAELANHLGLNRFSALGISGGGPYAAACGARIPQFLSALLLVSSVGPSDAPDATKGMVFVNRCLLSLARHFPRVAQVIARTSLWAIWGKGKQVIPKSIEARLPKSDQQALTSQRLREILTSSSEEALRHGVRAAAAEGLLYGRSWGFSLQEISTRSYLWHGEADIVVPATMGHYLAEHVPGCQAHFYPDDGHFSLAFTRCREILKMAV